MVLIIEDEDDVREAFADLLKHRGYHVTTAANGQEALAFLAQHPDPCVVLLDLVMPVMDGWQFLSALQSDPALAQLPVVIVSAHAGSHPPAGSIEILRKPFELDDFFAVVERHCGPVPPV